MALRLYCLSLIKHKRYIRRANVWTIHDFRPLFITATDRYADSGWGAPFSIS